MPTKFEEQDDRRIAEKAAEWLLVLPKAGLREHGAFAEWLRESPRHVEEFLLVSAAYRELDSAPMESLPDRAALRAELLADVVSLPQRSSIARSKIAPETRSKRSSSRRKLAAAAALLGVAIGSSWLFLLHSKNGESYSTAIGEIRSLELRDGSLVQLNAKTQVSVHFTEQGRELHLLEGEATFKVSRDPARPFRVHAGKAVIQALGTEFNVNRRTQATIVSVLQGAVRVTRDDKVQVEGVRQQSLAAGQGASITSTGEITRVEKADTAKATAWHQRRLLFNGDRLADVAEAFNRYNRTPQIRVEGDRARDTPLGGVFDADDPESLVKFLDNVPNLTVEQREKEVVIRDR